MRLLFTTPILEHPAAGGPQLRIENSIKALSRVCDLDIVSGSPYSVGVEGVENKRFYQEYCQEFHSFPRVRARELGNRYLRSLCRAAARLHGSDVDRDASFILDHVDHRSIDVVWFGYGNISYPLIRRVKTLRPELKVVCDTDSVWSRFLLRELPYAKGFRKLRIRRAGRKKEAEERAWVNLCDVTLAVSEVDAAYYRSIAADPGRIHQFSNVIDMITYCDVPPPAIDIRSPSIYLAGTFWPGSPMDNAARWIIGAVLPQIRHAVPNVRFIIAGRDSDVVLGDIEDPGIVVTGKLPSVLPYLCHADVAVVPLKFESGTRFKILEAGACKIPVVSTTLGAEGIPVVDGEHVLIADDPDAFANSVVKLLSNRTLAHRLARNCQALVSRRYSVESLAAEAKAILEYLAHV